MQASLSNLIEIFLHMRPSKTFRFYPFMALILIIDLKVHTNIYLYIYIFQSLCTFICINEFNYSLNMFRDDVNYKQYTFYEKLIVPLKGFDFD